MELKLIIKRGTREHNVEQKGQVEVIYWEGWISRYYVMEKKFLKHQKFLGFLWLEMSALQ